jgi:hypothetical protein
VAARSLALDEFFDRHCRPSHSSREPPIGSVVSQREVVHLRRCVVDLRITGRLALRLRPAQTAPAAAADSTPNQTCTSQDCA